MRSRWLWVRGPVAAVLAAALWLGCSGEEAGRSAGDPAATAAETTAPEWFEDAAAPLGIDFRHVRATGDQLWFPEMSSGGGGWIDYDGDGDQDLYLVQGGDLPTGPDPRFHNALYRNDGERFVDVTASAGVGDTGFGMGLAVLDYDGDGDEDLYVANYGPNVLYRNEGDGTFSDVTAAAGVGESAWTTSVAPFDIEPDGDIDLFLANYVAWSPSTEVECTGVGGIRDYCGPNRYQAPAPDTLYRNDGNGVFTDVSAESGIGESFGNGLGVTALDFDGDSSTELYVANDLMANQLWFRSADGRWVDEAIERGCAVNMAGAAEAGMGVAVGDVDLNGLPDLLVTHLAQETNTLYLNHDGLCADSTTTSGLAMDSLSRTGFGTVFADFDHDGWLDLWVSNGRVARARLGGDGASLDEPNLLYRGTGPARFEIVAPSRPDGPLGRAETGRATAVADFDLDGDPDILEVNNQGPARLLRNRAADGRPWMAVLPVEANGTRTPLARVRFDTVAGERWTAARRAASYCSSHEPIGHLGLSGLDEAPAELRVVWPGGATVVLRSPPANRRLVVRRPGG